jgi:hypothetical protein
MGEGCSDAFVMVPTVYCVELYRFVLSRDIVTIDGVWIGNRIHWTLTERNPKELRQSYWVTHSKDHCNYSTHKVFSVCCASPVAAWWRVSTMSSASMRTFLDAGYYITNKSLLQLLTPRIKVESKLCYDWRSVGQSVLVSSTHLGLTTRFFCRKFAGSLMWGALSDERTGLSFTIYNVQYIYILHVITWMYIHRAYRSQSRLSTADHVLSWVASAYES